MDIVNSKFEWARHHFELLNEQVSSYMKTNPCRFVADPEITTDVRGRRFVYGRLRVDTPIPDSLSMVLGDCLSNLRSCLDYLIWELVRANGNNPSDRSGFPICIKPSAWDKEIKRGTLDGIDNRAGTLIETMQPYHAGNPEQSLLAVLHEFTNINKHRRLLLTSVKTQAPPHDIKTVDGQSFALLNPPRTQDDAVFGPFEVIGDQVKMEAQAIAFIGIDEAPAKRFELTSLVERIARFIDQDVLPQFDEFFR